MVNLKHFSSTTAAHFSAVVIRPHVFLARARDSRVLCHFNSPDEDQATELSPGLNPKCVWMADCSLLRASWDPFALAPNATPQIYLPRRERAGAGGGHSGVSLGRKYQKNKICELRNTRLLKGKQLRKSKISLVNRLLLCTEKQSL